MLKDFDSFLAQLTTTELLSLLSSLYESDSENQISVLTHLGEEFYKLEDFEKSEALLHQALLIARKSKPIVHLNIDVIGTKLSLVYTAQGRYSDAESLLEEALRIRRKILPENRSEISTRLFNLCSVYVLQGRYSDAEPLLKESLVIARKALPVDHPDILRRLYTLSSLYQVQNRYLDAEPLLKEELEIIRKSIPRDDVYIGQRLANLGSLCAVQSRYSEAELFLKEALGIARKFLPIDHPDIVTGLNNLGSLYQVQGRYLDAEPLLKEELEIIRKSIPRDDVYIGKRLTNLGSLCVEQSRCSDAEPFLEEALEIARKSLPVDHLDIVTGLNNLGTLYQLLGRYSDSEPLHKEALDIAREFLKDDDPDFGTVLNNLGSLFKVQGLYLEAEPIFKEALDIARKSLPPNHPNIGRGLNNLGTLFTDQGRNLEAEPLLKEALDIARKSMPPDLPVIGRCLNNLGALFIAQGRNLEAEPLLREALKIIQKSLPVDHPNIGRNLNILGSLYEALSRESEAVPLFQSIIQVMQFEAHVRVNAFAKLARIAYKQKAKDAVNHNLYEAWNLISHAETDSSYLDEYAFNLASNEIDCWALLNNPFKCSIDTSRRLRERLNLISESNRPFWAEKLHTQYAEFHVKWMQYSLADNEPDRVPLVLSLVSGWRATQFIFDDIDTIENISTLPNEVADLKKWRKELHSLRLQLQPLTSPTKEQEAKRAHFSPEGIAEQEQRLQKLYADYDSAKSNMFRSQQELAKFPDYAALATDIGIDITELRSNLKAQEAIAICIDFSAHNFKGILLVFDEYANTKTQWIDLSSFDTKDGLNRLDYFNRKFGGGRGFRRGDISSADTSSKANEEDGIEYSPEDFWPEFQSYIKQGFWDELGNSLEGIEQLTLITQGNMHSLPLEMGAPQNLTLVRYPSITLYNMQQKIRDEKPAADANPVIGLACSTDNGIWFAKQEANAIAELYKNNPERVIQNYDFLTSEREITAAHLSGHGFHNDAHAHQAGLDMGGAELWTQPKLLSSKARPKRVFISACVAGKTTENSEGDVYGIAAAFMLRGTRELSAAIVNMNDPWMFLMGYRVEEYLLHNPTHSQYTALKHAKDDLVNQKPIPLPVLNKWRQRVNDDLSSIINTSAPESEGRNQQLDEFIKYNTTLQIDEEKFRKDFLTVPRRDTNNTIANYEFTFRNTPCEPILGSVLYGILHFGK